MKAAGGEKVEADKEAMCEAAKKGDLVMVRPAAGGWRGGERTDEWMDPRSYWRHWHIPIVKLLHGGGANVNASDNYAAIASRATALMWAAGMATSAVKYLVEKAGADKDAKSNGETATDWAMHQPPDGLRLPRPGSGGEEGRGAAGEDEHGERVRHLDASQRRIDDGAGQGQGVGEHRAIRSVGPRGEDEPRVETASSSSSAN